MNMKLFVASTIWKRQRSKIDILNKYIFFYAIMIIQTKDYDTFYVGSKHFVGALKASKALVGDSVEITEEPDVCVSKILSRAEHINLVGTLEISGKTKYGFTSRNVPIYLFIPYNEAYPPFYVGSSHIDKRKNLLVVIDFDSWSETANCPRGICKRILGASGNLEAEKEALKIHTHSINWKHICELNPSTPFFQGGSYLDTDTFHVDPEGCVDIDDAISIWSNNSYIEVRIHIADVASLLANNKFLWNASKLGETLYNNGKIVSPLFPVKVQEMCSLTPNTLRPTFTLAFTWNIETNSIVKKWWSQQDIVVKYSYNYESILNTQWAPLLKTIASGISSKSVTDPHEWIAELMIFYNKEAAKVIQGSQQGILRRHSEPDKELLNALEKTGLAPFLAYKAGTYCDATENDVVHWGLNEAVYTHATSPIRRWVDCINQAILIQTLFIAEFTVPPYTIESINKQSKLCKSFERDNFFLKMLLSKDEIIVTGQVILAGPQKAKIWIPVWNRCVSIYEYRMTGEFVEISFHMNPSKRNWKRKIILEILE